MEGDNRIILDDPVLAEYYNIRGGRIRFAIAIASAFSLTCTL
jgi:hypothetical protein